MHTCIYCDKTFTRSDNLKRHNISCPTPEPQLNLQVNMEESNDTVDDSTSISEEEGNGNDSSLSQKEIEKIRRRISRAERGISNLTKDGLSQMVEDMSGDSSDDDSSESTDSDDSNADDGKTMDDQDLEGESVQDESDKNQVISGQNLNFLREMFKSVEFETFGLTRQMFFDIVYKLK